MPIGIVAIRTGPPRTAKKGNPAVAGGVPEKRIRLPDAKAYPPK
jgi:hypothetical protein